MSSGIPSMILSQISQEKTGVHPVIFLPRFSFRIFSRTQAIISPEMPQPISQDFLLNCHSVFFFQNFSQQFLYEIPLIISSGSPA